MSVLMKEKNRKTSNRKKYETVFHPEFTDDLRYWIETDRNVALRVPDLIESIVGDPFEGIGKSEPLKYLAQGV